MYDCCSSLQVMRINADLEKLEKRVTDMEKNFIQINVSGTSIHFFSFFLGGGIVLTRRIHTVQCI